MPIDDDTVNPSRKLLSGAPPVLPLRSHAWQGNVSASVPVVRLHLLPLILSPAFRHACALLSYRRFHLFQGCDLHAKASLFLQPVLAPPGNELLCCRGLRGLIYPDKMRCCRTHHDAAAPTHLTSERPRRRFRRVAPPVVGRYDGGGVLPGARRGFESR